MKLNFYSIKDSRSGQYGIPFTAVNDDVAKRQFLMFVADNSFAEEFKLMRLGEFCDGIDSDDVGIDGLSFPVVVDITEDEIKAYREVLRKMRTVSK